MPREIKVHVTADSKQANKELQALEGQLRKLGPAGVAAADALGALGTKGLGVIGALTVVGAVIGGGVAIAEKAISGYIDLADSIRKYANVTGQSAETSSRQVEAFQALGVNAETATAGMFRLGRESETAAKKLEAVGVQVQYNADGTVNLDHTLMAVVDAWQAAGSAAQKDAIVYTAFGKAGADMIPILETNSAQLKTLEAQAAKVLTSADLERVREYQIQQQELKQQTDQLGYSLGQTLVPAALAVVESANKNIYVNQRLAETQADLNDRAPTWRGATMAQAKAFGDEWDAAQKAKVGLDALTQAANDNAAAAAADEAATQKSIDAVNKEFAAGEGYQQSLIDLQKAQKDYNDAGGKGEEVNLRLEEAILRVAQAAVDSAKVGAAANGVTLDASQQLQVEIDSLKQLASTLDPNGAVHKDIEDHIRQLQQLQDIGNIDTQISTTIAGRPAGGKKLQHFAEPGIVQGPPGSTVPVLAEAGEHFGGYPPRNGGGNHYHFHIGTLVASPHAKDQLLNELLRHARIRPGT
jgi:hypothetical protein